MLLFFFFNDTATTEIYTLSLHDALPISWAGRSPKLREGRWRACCSQPPCQVQAGAWVACACGDRKSTRLNSSHRIISYAVFCLKKKKTTIEYHVHDNKP